MPSHDAEEETELLKQENENLRKQIEQAEKHLEKQKSFHRKFAEDAISHETIIIKEFEQEKRTLEDELKALRRVNRELKKDNDYLKLLSKSIELDDGKSNQNKATQGQITKIKNENTILKAKIKSFQTNKKLVSQKMTRLTNTLRRYENKSLKNQQLTTELNDLIKKRKTANQFYSPDSLKKLKESFSIC